MTDPQDIVYQDAELEAADEAAKVVSYWSMLKARGMRGALLDQLTKQYAWRLGIPVCSCDPNEDPSE